MKTFISDGQCVNEVSSALLTIGILHPAIPKPRNKRKLNIIYGSPPLSLSHF